MVGPAAQAMGPGRSCPRRISPVLSTLRVGWEMHNAGAVAWPKANHVRLARERTWLGLRPKPWDPGVRVLEGFHRSFPRCGLVGRCTTPVPWLGRRPTTSVSRGREHGWACGPSHGTRAFVSSKDFAGPFHVAGWLGDAQRNRLFGTLQRASGGDFLELQVLLEVFEVQMRAADGYVDGDSGNLFQPGFPANRAARENAGKERLAHYTG